MSLASARSIFRLSGAEVIPFLQGIVTSDVSGLAEPGSKPVYAALLTAQGRFLHDLFLHTDSSSATSTILADTASDSAASLLTLLKRYKLRARVDVADVSSELSAWVTYGTATPHPEWPADPRLRQLGSRAIAPVSPHAQPAADTQHYQHFRFRQGIAEGSELPHGQAVPLEYNLDGLQGISYSKGCYVGQELIARAHYQGVVRKRLMPAAITPGDALIVPGAELTADGQARSVGKIIAVNGDVALVLVRLKAALQAAGGQAVLFVAGTTAAVKPYCPDWWPEHWKESAAEISSART